MQSAKGNIPKTMVKPQERPSKCNIFASRTSHINNPHVKHIVHDLMSRGVISGSSSMFFVLCGDDYENASSEDVTVLIDDYENEKLPENVKKADVKTIQFFNKKKKCRPYLEESHEEYRRTSVPNKTRKSVNKGLAGMSCERCNQDEDDDEYDEYTEVKPTRASTSHRRSTNKQYHRDDYDSDNDVGTSKKDDGTLLKAEVKQRPRKPEKLTCGSCGSRAAEEEYYTEKPRSHAHRKSDVIKRHVYDDDFDDEEYTYVKRDKIPKRRPRHREYEMPLTRSSDSLQYNVQDTRQYHDYEYDEPRFKDMQMKRQSYRSRDRDMTEGNWEEEKDMRMTVDSRRQRQRYSSRKRLDELYNVTGTYREDEVGRDYESDNNNEESQSDSEVPEENTNKRSTRKKESDPPGRGILKQYHSINGRNEINFKRDKPAKKSPPGADLRNGIDCADVLREIKRCVGAISEMTNTLYGIQQVQAASKAAIEFSKTATNSTDVVEFRDNIKDASTHHDQTESVALTQVPEDLPSIDVHDSIIREEYPTFGQSLIETISTYKIVRYIAPSPWEVETIAPVSQRGNKSTDSILYYNDYPTKLREPDDKDVHVNEPCKCQGLPAEDCCKPIIMKKEVNEDIPYKVQNPYNASCDDVPKVSPAFCGIKFHVEAKGPL